jgi:hypothetical protein
MVHRTKLRLVLLGILLSLCACLTYAQNSPTHVVAFPAYSRATSPNGRYAVINVDSDLEPYYHAVFLEDRKLKTRRQILKYERHAEVLWNPDGKSFSFSDFAGSDSAVCSIVRVNEKAAAIPVLDNLLKRPSAAEREHIQRNDHLYIEGVRWIDAKTLLVKIWGHDSDRRKAFERFYRYRVP